MEAQNERRTGTAPKELAEKEGLRDRVRAMDWPVQRINLTDARLSSRIHAVKLKQWSPRWITRACRAVEVVNDYARLIPMLIGNADTKAETTLADAGYHSTVQHARGDVTHDYSPVLGQRLRFTAQCNSWCTDDRVP